ncbi:MAG: hypothetical protein RQM90_11290 [Methanoculleus sp.]
MVPLKAGRVHPVSFPEDKLEPALADYANDIGPYESKSFQNAIRQAFLTQPRGTTRSLISSFSG